jgi:hypothetical protein
MVRVAIAALLLAAGCARTAAKGGAAAKNAHENNL